MTQARQGMFLVTDDRSDMVDEYCYTHEEAVARAKKQSKEHGGVFAVWGYVRAYKGGEDVSDAQTR